MVCYRFDTAEQWRTLALANGLAFTVEGAFVPLSTHGIAIDDIGTVYDTAGNPLTGHHVNVIHPNPPEALDPYLVVVSTAYRTFLGAPLQAPDDATLEEILA